ncbi:hypothetical protein OVY01_10750 [Robbsia sp. Bb-Pol-6]|uniref:Beta-xylosidase n=1 Tax=Robbsia betulipollinis TaxID=2981849 RepID=A0ABT3ZMC8_9BURK|nr:hypothetical protein [Robbsia betulipollinis]MCY0387704.1 hypothetical protein [Robbsia betulipollinis]
MKNTLGNTFRTTPIATARQTPGARRAAPAIIALMLALAGFGSVAEAQTGPITSGNSDGSGSGSSISGGASGQTPDGRNSAMGAQAQASTRTVVEGSEKPTAEHPANNRRSKSASHKSTKKSEGSSGFEKGMYGTGTGSTGNK